MSQQAGISDGQMDFVVESGSSDDHTYSWNHSNTLTLLELYKKYRKDVGTVKLRNLKRMFEEIAKEIQLLCNKNITVANCENRWKHLERTYRKYIENKNKTGRARKDFQYANELDEILGKKRNIQPLLLLGSESASSSVSVVEIAQSYPISSKSRTTADEKMESTPAPQATQVTVRTTEERTKYTERTARSNVLKGIRKDRQKFYDQRLEIANAELDIKREELDIRRGELEIKREELKERRKLNATLGETNELLRHHLLLQ